MRHFLIGLARRLWACCLGLQAHFHAWVEECDRNEAMLPAPRHKPPWNDFEEDSDTSTY